MDKDPSVAISNDEGDDTNTYQTRLKTKANEQQEIVPEAVKDRFVEDKEISDELCNNNTIKRSDSVKNDRDNVSKLPNSGKQGDSKPQQNTQNNTKNEHVNLKTVPETSGTIITDYVVEEYNYDSEPEGKSKESDQEMKNAETEDEPEKIKFSKDRIFQIDRGKLQNPQNDVELSIDVIKDKNIKSSEKIKDKKADADSDTDEDSDESEKGSKKKASKVSKDKRNNAESDKDEKSDVSDSGSGRKTSEEIKD